MGNHITYRGTRKNGTILFVHTHTGPDQPVYVSVVKNGIWKESQAYYYEEDAMEAVNKAWPDVVWNKAKNVDLVKYVINETGIHEEDYVANVVADFFANTFDLEEAEDALTFQCSGKWYEVEFHTHSTGESWQFHDDKGNTLVELRWT